MQDTPSHAVSFEALYETYRAPVLLFLKRRCAVHADAEDLTEAIFEYIYRNYDKYDPEKASPRSWVFMIAVSRWKNYCRDRMVMSDIDEFSEVLHDDRDFAEEAVNVDALRAGLAQALKQLTEQQRKVVILRYFRHATDQEIALRLRLTSANVRVIAHRALKSMESSLKGQGVWSD